MLWLYYKNISVLYLHILLKIKIILLGQSRSFASEQVIGVMVFFASKGNLGI